MTTNKVSSESPFYFQLIHVNNIWIIKTVFVQNGYRLQWYGIFPPFLIQYLPQLGLLVEIMAQMILSGCFRHAIEYIINNNAHTLKQQHSLPSATWIQTRQIL